jgi:hypothetical protein
MAKTLKIPSINGLQRNASTASMIHKQALPSQSTTTLKNNERNLKTIPIPTRKQASEGQPTYTIHHPLHKS